MPILSLSSDLGENNYSLAQWQALLLSHHPNYKILDLFHHNEIHDIESIAYQIVGALETFPEGSIHLAYSKYSTQNTEILICPIRNQYVICPNNGLISLIQSIDYHAKVYLLNSIMTNFSFPDYQRQYLRALHTIEKKTIETDCSEIVTFIQTKPFNTDLVLLNQQIITRVISTDKVGNVVVNLRDDVFYEHVQNRAFYLLFHSIKIFQFSPNYAITYNNNRIGALFNTSGFLEIFMVGGNLSKLFNINKWSNNKLEIFIDNDSNRQINFQTRT